MDKELKAKLIESLADVFHQAWEKWAGAVKSEVKPERSARWDEYMVPYEQLEENIKDLDREWAIEALDAIEADLSGESGGPVKEMITKVQIDSSRYPQLSQILANEMGPVKEDGILLEKETGECVICGKNTSQKLNSELGPEFVCDDFMCENEFHEATGPKRLAYDEGGDDETESSYPQLSSLLNSRIEAKTKRGKKAKAGAKKPKAKKAKAKAEAEKKLAAKKRSLSVMDYPAMKKAKVRSDFEGSEYDPHLIASQWHGGQFSELYKFSSSGMVDSKFSAIWEVERAMDDVKKNPSAFEADEMEKLEFLKNYFEKNLPEDPPDEDELPVK